MGGSGFQVCIRWTIHVTLTGHHLTVHENKIRLGYYWEEAALWRGRQEECQIGSAIKSYSESNGQVIIFFTKHTKNKIPLHAF